MSDQVYKEMLPVMQKRGGPYAGADIREFYDVVKVLFTPDQAAVNNALPARPVTAERLAQSTGRETPEIGQILESMADNGLCSAFRLRDEMHYVALPFMIGIFEFQFMRGTATERDKKIARAIDSYKKAFKKAQPPKTQKAVKAR